MRITEFRKPDPALLVGTATNTISLGGVTVTAAGTASSSSNTIATVGSILVATSSNTATWQDALSFGSNTNDVSSIGTMGASASNTRADHVHRGVHSIAHASNTLYGDVIFTTPGNTVGITSPAPGTLALIAVGGGGAGGAPTDAKYLVTAGSESLSAEVIISGLAGSPDIDVAGANDHEFNSSTLDGTQFGTLNTENADTTIRGHYYSKKLSAGLTMAGRFWLLPGSGPKTITAKITDYTVMNTATWYGPGLYIGRTSFARMIGIHVLRSTNGLSLDILDWQSGIGGAPTNLNTHALLGDTISPLYLRITVNSYAAPHGLDFYYSFGGLVWKSTLTGYNLGGALEEFGIGVMAVTQDSEAAYDFLRIA